MIDEMSKLEPIPCPEYGGLKWPTFIPFREKGAEKAVKDMMNMESRKSDILICTYVKSGTHWTYEILHMLVNNTTELAKEAKLNTMLEMLPDFNEVNSLPSPRILDTHNQFQYLPQSHIEKRAKIVHMIRNPKDVLVSFYHHAIKDKFLNCINYSWKQFFEEWIAETLPFGSWYDYELGIEQAEKDYPGMIFTCCYEAMKKDPNTNIRQLAKFLGVKCSDETIESIVRATSFDNMKKNKHDPTRSLTDGKGFIYRKGQVGDWKNYFTVAQNERFDAQFQNKMKNSSYRFSFE